MNENIESPLAKGYSESAGSWQKKSMRAFIPNSGSPSEDIDLNNYTMRQRGRMLYMAAPIATSAINTNRTKVVGVGLKLNSCIDREVLGMTQEQAVAWQKKTEREFMLWAGKKEACDATGMNNFAAMQQLALTSWLTSGDVFATITRAKATPAMPYSLRLHLLEADRVSTPTKAQRVGPVSTEGKTQNGNKIFDGVEVDGAGMVIAYYISNNYPMQRSAELMEWTRVKAYGEKTGLPNILHVMSSERPEQYRGVTYLAPVMETILQLRRYTESELMAALVQSFFTAFVLTETAANENPLSEMITDTLPGEAPSIPRTQTEYGMGPGSMVHLKPGEDVKLGNPNVPTTGFEMFVHTICELIGASLELPSDILLKKFDRSYSASRGALLEAWEAFRMRRAWFVDDFCQPIYEIWLSEAVATGRITAPGFFSDPLIRAAWCGASWIGPVQGQLDPVKEVTANKLAVEQGFKTRSQVTAEMGGDWNTNMEQLAIENELIHATREKDVAPGPKEKDL